MTQEQIDNIVLLFKEAKIWNDGKFLSLVENYCDEYNLNKDLIRSKLEIAYRDYLMTSIKSEDAIKFRLKELIKI